MYVKRDSTGLIVAVSLASQPGFEEQIDPADPAVHAFQAAFMAPDQSVDEQARQLRNSDTELVRVVEDLVNLLTDKGIIQFTELPEAAQRKLLERKNLRKHIRHLDLLDEDDPDQLMP